MLQKKPYLRYFQIQRTLIQKKDLDEGLFGKKTLTKVLMTLKKTFTERLKITVYRQTKGLLAQFRLHIHISL